MALFGSISGNTSDSKSPQEEVRDEQAARFANSVIRGTWNKPDPLEEDD